MLINLKLNNGTSKAGKPYYMLQTICGKFTSEPVFISELEFDYLSDMVKINPQDNFNLSEE